MEENNKTLGSKFSDMYYLGLADIIASADSPTTKCPKGLSRELKKLGLIDYKLKIKALYLIDLLISIIICIIAIFLSNYALFGLIGVIIAYALEYHAELLCKQFYQREIARNVRGNKITPDMLVNNKGEKFGFYFDNHFNTYYFMINSEKLEHSFNNYLEGYKNKDKIAQDKSSSEVSEFKELHVFNHEVYFDPDDIINKIEISEQDKIDTTIDNIFPTVNDYVIKDEQNRNTNKESNENVKSYASKMLGNPSNKEEDFLVGLRNANLAKIKSIYKPSSDAYDLMGYINETFTKPKMADTVNTSIYAVGKFLDYLSEKDEELCKGVKKILIGLYIVANPSPKTLRLDTLLADLKLNVITYKEATETVNVLLDKNKLSNIYHKFVNTMWSMLNDGGDYTKDQMETMIRMAFYHVMDKKFVIVDEASLLVEMARISFR